MREIVLIHITGADRPGVTAAFTRALSEGDADVLDIGQAVIHNYLTLGILVSVPGNTDSLFKELLFLGHELELTVSFSVVDEASYGNWVRLQGRGRFILTLLARRIRAEHLGRVAKLVSEFGLNIDNISRLSGRVPLEGAAEDTRACVEFSLRGDIDDPESFRRALLGLSGELDVDAALQADDLYRRHRRLIAFDMDSTLLDTEVIDELALRAGVGDEVLQITRRAMEGELDFAASLQARVAMLAGLPESELDYVVRTLSLMEGAERLFATLRKLGYRTAILSGGFQYFGDTLKTRLGVDYVFANRLEIENGALTGEVTPPIVDADRKALLLREIAEREGIAMQQVIAVGDWANDLRMLAAAGLGIAFRGTSFSSVLMSLMHSSAQTPLADSRATNMSQDWFFSSWMSLSADAT